MKSIHGPKLGLLLPLLLLGLAACGGNDNEGDDDASSTPLQSPTPIETEDSPSPTPTPTPEPDLDGDGFSPGEGDCNDNDPELNPEADEICDGVDQDCDGDIDEGVTLTYYQDSDGDGFGEDRDEASFCEDPGEGWASQGGDCDDTDAEVNPDQPEICNEIDDDCDGLIDDQDVVDEGETYYVDSDQDGYGNPDITVVACEIQIGTVENGEDCDDLDDHTYPGAVEVCDGKDNDCNNEVDDDILLEWYLDEDGDGYGDSANPVQGGCEGVSGYVEFSGDCDDSNASINPEAADLANGVDDDCDGSVDEVVTAVAAGWIHSLAVTSDGKVMAWGGNGTGQLGDGTTDERRSPVEVLNISTAVDVQAGRSHSVVLLSDGRVMTFGQNNSGQLGDGSGNQSSVPVEVSGLENIVAIASGMDHVLALDASGVLWAWGANDVGQLGDGTTTSRDVPVEVEGVGGVTAIGAGDDFSFAIDEAGVVYGWGQSTAGQLGTTTPRGVLTPTEIDGLDGAVQLSGGLNHSLALLADGTVLAWGSNRDGQLGNDSLDQTTTPTEVAGVEDAVLVGAGTGFSLSLVFDGTILSWGANDSGQLGNGTSEGSSSPTMVLFEDAGAGDYAVQASALSAGTGHGLAVTTSGRAVAWGENASGQIGDGTTETAFYAVVVPSLP